MALAKARINVISHLSIQEISSEILSGDQRTAMLIAVSIVDTYLTEAARLQARITRAPRRIVRQLQERANTPFSAAPEPHLYRWTAFPFCAVHFYANCWTIIGKHLKVIRDILRLPPVGRALRAHDHLFRKYRVVRDPSPISSTASVPAASEALAHAQPENHAADTHPKVLQVFPAWAKSGGKVISRTATPAGELVIVEFEADCRYVVRLASTGIVVTECGHPDSVWIGDRANRYDGTLNAKPEVIKAMGPAKPFDEVLFMQQFAGGNVCNGSNLWFLGTNRDGSYAISDQIPFCGGHDPVVAREDGALNVTLPGIPDLVLTEKWDYRGGKVRKLGSTAELPPYAVSGASSPTGFNSHELVGKHPWVIFDYADLDRAIRTLLGSQYSSFKQHITVAGPSWRDGDYVIGEGCVPHGCSLEMGYFAIGLSNHDVHCAIFSSSAREKVRTFSSTGNLPNQLKQRINEAIRHSND